MKQERGDCQRKNNAFWGYSEKVPSTTGKTRTYLDAIRNCMQKTGEGGQLRDVSPSQTSVESGKARGEGVYSKRSLPTVGRLRVAMLPVQ
jgi:hypothetical protein